MEAMAAMGSEAESQELGLRCGDTGVNFPSICPRLATSFRVSLFE